MLLQLTDKTGTTVYVNLKHIISFGRWNGHELTTIRLTYGGGDKPTTMSVQESPLEISNIANDMAKAAVFVPA